MRNRLYILFFLIIFGNAGLTFAQVPSSRAGNKKTSSSSKKPEIPNYTLLQNKSFAHWSYGVCLGGSVFDGDINENIKRIVPTSSLAFTLGGNIERTFNPIFGIGVEYVYIPYSAEPDNTTNKLQGVSQEGDIYLSVNLSNLFYRSRPQKWGVFFNIGIGMAFYNANMKDMATGNYVKDPSGKEMNLSNGIAWVWPFSLGFEYNASKHFALGLKAGYRMYNKDNFEGYVTNVRQGNSNDGMSIIVLTLRHKLHFSKSFHVRNLSYGDLNMRDMSRLAELENALKNMKPAESSGDTCCATLTDKIAKLEKALNERRPDTVVRIIEQPAKTTVDEKTKRTFKITLRGIQFETAKSDIKVVSYPILEDIVLIMNENPSYELDIIGHTDDVGDSESNQDLSDRRAHSVRSFLMNRGVSGTRLISSGKGKTQPISTNSTEEGRALNRRVEFVVKEGGKTIFKTDER